MLLVIFFKVFVEYGSEVEPRPINSTEGDKTELDQFYPSINVWLRVWLPHMLALLSKPDPFWVISEFQLAWVLDFCLWTKKMENPNFFGNRTPFTYCPRGFFESRHPKLIEIESNIDRNRTISARYALLVLIFNAIWKGRHLWPWKLH